MNFRTARVTRVDETRLRLQDVLQKRGLSNWRKTEDDDRFLQCSQTVSTFTANTSRHNHPFGPNLLRYPHLLRSEVFKRSSLDFITVYVHSTQSSMTIGDGCFYKIKYISVALLWIWLFCAANPVFLTNKTFFSYYILRDTVNCPRFFFSFSQTFLANSTTCVQQ